MNVKAHQLIAGLVSKAQARAEIAMREYPQPNYVLTKFAEEAGEVVKDGVHLAEDRGDVSKYEDEMIDCLATMFRLVAEGDGVHGLKSLVAYKFGEG